MSYKNELSEELVKRIMLEVPTDDKGFWCSSTPEVFFELAFNLQLADMTDNEIVQQLGAVYSAVAAEFGA